MEIVDQPGRDQRRQPYGNALAVVVYGRSRGLAGKLLQLRFLEVLCLASQKQALRTVGRNVVIEPLRTAGLTPIPKGSIFCIWLGPRA